MNQFSHLRDQGYGRLAEAPMRFQADREPERKQAPAKGNSFEWAGTLCRVGAFLGAILACCAAGKANRGIAALGGIAGAIVGGLVGLMIDCCCS